MTNPFYTPTGNPATGARGLSALVRQEFASIGIAFDMMPRIATTGLFDTTFIQQGSYSLTLPSTNGTLALTDDVAVIAEALGSETLRAMQVEGRMATDISTLASTEKTDRTTAIGFETARARAAEKVNADAIAKELSERAGAIGDEFTRATAAETANARAITAEVGARKDAIIQEAGYRTGDIQRLTDAGSGYATAIANEIARAKTVENSKQPNLGFDPYPSSNPLRFQTDTDISNQLRIYAPYSWVSDNFIPRSSSTSFVQSGFTLSTVYLGYSGNSALVAQVDSTYIGRVPCDLWPGTFVRTNDSPTFTGLHVNGESIRANGGREAAANGYTLNSGGINPVGAVVTMSIESNNGVMAPSFFAISDARLKSDRTAITDEEGEAFVLKCPPYRYIKGGIRECGFMAQDLGRAGFAETLAAWIDESIPDEAHGYDGPKGRRLIMPDKTPTAYIAAALRSALTKIEAMAADIDRLQKRQGET